MKNNKILILKYLNQNNKTKNLILQKILNLKSINQININKINKNNFINWLIGFSDGEGSFVITFRKNKNNEINRIIFSFKIKLHMDDKYILDTLLKLLNLNNNKVYIYNSKSGNKEVEIIISKTEDIKNIIIPIFNKPHYVEIPAKGENKLNTKKAHDFNIWVKMFNINNNKNITWNEKYPLLLNLSKTLNNYNYKHNDDELNININWYIGFMEGEGSYSIKYDKNNKYTLISEVSQREESIKLFKEMKIYLKNLPVDVNCPDIIREYIKNIKINIVEYKKTNKIKLTISSIDYFYWVYFPNILKHEWNTRKSIDMTYFMIATIILKHGLHYTKEGAKLYEYIRNNNNNLP